MNVTFTLAVFGWTIGTFDVRVNVDQQAVANAQPVVDHAVKRISRRWVRRMTA